TTPSSIRKSRQRAAQYSFQRGPARIGIAKVSSRRDRQDISPRFIATEVVRKMWKLLFALLLALPQSVTAQDISTAPAATPTGHPILALGSAAPDFSLPGVDGRTHTLGNYAVAPILVIVFTCNHCPIAQMYEQRIQQLE